MGPFNLEKIPPELKARPQWVAWREETREGKKTKIPYQPRDPEQKASSTNPDTWGTFAQALSAAQTNGFHGVGYVFSPQDDYAGVDLDKCRDRETGEIEPWARAKIDRLNSYTEESPSGTGFHVLIKGKVPTGGNKKGKVEMYSQARYFTMTGHHLEGAPATIEPRQGELEALHKEVFGKPQAAPQQPQAPSKAPSGANGLTDFALIDKALAAANGHKFELLWKGDTSAHGGDDSSADFDLCSRLAWWTGGDPGRIDRLFRQSGLMRKKWDRPTAGSTYGDMTINKALAGMTGFYQGPRSAPRPESRPKPESPKTSHSTATIETVSGPPTWPREVMAGAAGNFSKTFAAYLETPESFLYTDYLTVLGHVLSSSITLHSEIRPEPRLYTINLGESADTRKSTSVNKVCGFFSETLDREAIHEVLGVGSAEGLAKAFKRNPRVLLVSDELNALVQKMRIDASVLSPCICTLFESNRFHSLTKKHEISIDDAELCMLAACTLDTYRGMFTSQFLDIGLLNSAVRLTD